MNGKDSHARKERKNKYFLNGRKPNKKNRNNEK